MVATSVQERRGAYFTGSSHLTLDVDILRIHKVRDNKFRDLNFFFLFLMNLVSGNLIFKFRNGE